MVCKRLIYRRYTSWGLDGNNFPQSLKAVYWSETEGSKAARAQGCVQISCGQCVSSGNGVILLAKRPITDKLDRRHGISIPLVQYRLLESYRDLIFPRLVLDVSLPRWHMYAQVGCPVTRYIGQLHKWVLGIRHYFFPRWFGLGPGTGAETFDFGSPGTLKACDIPSRDM